MNCIIIEDQLPAQRILKKYISDAGTLHLVGVYTNALEALQILKKESIDLIFLDIHLPKISGIDFLKSLSNPPKIILTTAFQEYALESYELDVVDYLLKPFSFQRFVKAITKVSTSKNSADFDANYKGANLNVYQNQNNEVYIKSGYDFIRINLEEIIYIKTDLDYTELYTKDKKHLSSESLRYWESFLPDTNFMRIHKSFIINTSKILKISGNQAFFENDMIVPIGRTYKSIFAERFIKKD